MDIDIELPNFVRAVRHEKGLTMRQLAERMGVHFTTIAKIEKSHRRLTPDWARRFAEALEVEVSEILPTDEEVKYVNTNFRRLPVIGQVSAGQWTEAVENAEDTIPTFLRDKNAFGLRVEGDSMDKVVPDGAIVIIDPDKLDLMDGGYYVVMNADSETTFKRYRASPARLEPLSNNPRHAPIRLGQEPFTVLGMVVGAFQTFQ